MRPEIRKIVTYAEDVLIEGFRPADPPWRMFAVAAVVSNPWAGRFVENLKPEIQAYGPVLGALLTERMIRLAGSGAAIEAYGKAAVVGLDGEIEHASGLIHTLRLCGHYMPNLVHPKTGAPQSPIVPNYRNFCSAKYGL